MIDLMIFNQSLKKLKEKLSCSQDFSTLLKSGWISANYKDSKLSCNSASFETLVTPGDEWKVEWTWFEWKLPEWIWSHTTKSLYLPYLSFIRTLIKEFMTDTFRSMSEDLTRHRSHYTVGNFHIYTVVCIKVRTASFPRFWKNHP